jgi:predicted anti-sigma-YlaC factor YlaD
MKLKLDCKDVSRLLSDAQEHPPEPSEMARLRLHLVICEACRNVEEQMAFIRRAMQRLGHSDPPPPDRD